MTIDGSNKAIGRRSAVKAGAAILGGAVAGSAPWSLRHARAASAKPSRLTMLYATSEADSDAIKAALPDFKSIFGMDLVLDTMPYDALQQKAFAELASGSSYYDIMIVDTPWMPALTDKILPITDMILDPSVSNAAQLNLSDFIPKVFFDTAVYKRRQSYLHWPGQQVMDAAAIKKGGFEIYGLPIQANVATLAYRADMFSDAATQKAFQARTGKVLAVPETWDDFTTVAEFFTRPRKRLWGTTMMAGAGDWATDDFKTLLASFGGDGHLVNDQFQPVFDSPQGIQALSYYVDLIAKKRVTPPGTTSASWDTAATAFGSGLAAMSINYHSETLNPMVKGSIAYGMVPKKVQYGPHFGTWMLSVNSYSKNKEWAYQAIEWFTSKPVQVKALATQLHPTRRSVYDVAMQDAGLTQRFANFYEVLGKSLEVGVGRPRLTNYADVDRAVWIAVNDAARQAEKPDVALRKAAMQVKKLLVQAGYKPA
ncbi:MAG: extracellular solute-binding protein [Proteobacteria bacterium]|nr:extracellular solute-binding protein [Pseudomonadota bacterium]